MHRAGLPILERKLGDDELFDLDARVSILPGLVRRSERVGIAAMGAEPEYHS
jgi:hypothetical protein